MRTGEFIQKMYESELSRISQEIEDVIPAILAEKEILSLLKADDGSGNNRLGEIEVSVQSERVIFWFLKHTKTLNHNPIPFLGFYLLDGLWKCEHQNLALFTRGGNSLYVEAMKEYNLKYLKKLHPKQCAELLRSWAKSTLL